MKKDILVIGFLLMICFPAKPQITITSADLPVIGNMVVQAVDTITPVSPGNPGPNQYWDLSGLIASRFDTILYIPKEGLPNHLNYPGSNIVYNPRTVTVPGGSAIYSYWFMDHNENGMHWVGAEHMFSLPGNVIYTIHANYSPEYTDVPLPLRYGDSSIQDFEIVGTMGGRISGVLLDSVMTVSNNHVTIDADAYGTMKTPYDTYAVLRIKEVLTVHTIQYRWTSNGWELEDESTDPPFTSYRWYTNDYFEVGLCDGDSKGSGFTFFRSETFVGMQNPEPYSTFVTYPNPATDRLYISGKDKIDQIEVCNLSGHRVITGLYDDFIDVSRLSPGVYSLTILSNESVTRSEFIKK